MTRVRLTLKSRNAKTGPIPVSTTERGSCPSNCSLAGNGCYADTGPLAIVWRSVPVVGLPWARFCDAVRELPPGQLWRHNQAGDLPHEGQVIDAGKMSELVAANLGRRGFTYTHHDMAVAANRAAVADANRQGFTINLSANNLEQADALAALGIGPVVTLAPATQRDNGVTPGGRRVVVCPAVTQSGVTCATCKLCAVAGRDCVVAFPVHGARKRQATIAMGAAS